MAGPRHNWDEQAHKKLFEKVYNTFNTAIASLTTLVNASLGDVKTATNLAKNNTLMKRDEAGRSRIVAPIHELDISNKAYVDALTSPDIEISVFTASGVFTPKKTEWVSVILVGGGSGGGGVLTTNTSGEIIDGGPAGQIISVKVPVQEGVQEQIIIGGGGAPGKTGRGGRGAPGGTTKFGTLECYGGNLNSLSIGHGQRLSRSGGDGFSATIFGAPVISGGHSYDGRWNILAYGGQGYGGGGAGGASGSNVRHFGAGAPGICIVFSSK